MIVEHPSAPVTPLVDTAWTILDAANDLRDAVTVEAGATVTWTNFDDASFRGGVPAQSDINIVLTFSADLRVKALRLQNVGGVQALITSHGLAPTQRKRCGRRLSK